MKNLILGIDPGNEGAFVLTDGDKFLQVFEMPLKTNGKNREVDFDGIYAILFKLKKAHKFHVVTERAVPMAMGSKGAFNYGRGFAALEIAIIVLQIPVTFVEPQKWAKEMHQGISNDLKPKAKSLVAVKRLYPSLVKFLPIKPKNGQIKDGPIDALLIAGFGLRHGLHVAFEKQQKRINVETVDDFF